MGIKEYFSGIFNIGGDDEFETETVEETVETEEVEKERTARPASRKTYTSKRGQSDEDVPM